MRRLLLGLLCLSGCGDPVAPLVCVRWESAVVREDSTAVLLADVRYCVEYR
jgi:hypothetical protein